MRRERRDEPALPAALHACASRATGSERERKMRDSLPLVRMPLQPFLEVKRDSLSLPNQTGESERQGGEGEMGMEGK